MIARSSGETFAYRRRCNDHRLYSHKQTLGSTKPQRLSSLRTLNAPHFETAAGDAFKGVEIALFALRLYSEQTHFNVAERAEERGSMSVFETVSAFTNGRMLPIGCAPLLVGYLAANSADDRKRTFMRVSAGVSS